MLIYYYIGLYLSYSRLLHILFNVAPTLHVLRVFLLRVWNQSESSRDITSQPGYGRSPRKRMCIGHFSACASARLQVHAVRLLFFMSCRNCCSRAPACSLQPLHTMAYALSFFLLDRSAGAYAALPRSLRQGPAQGYSSRRRALQPRFWHSRHTTFCALEKWLSTLRGVKLCWGNMAAHAAHGISSHVRHRPMRPPLDRRKASRSWYTPHSRQRCFCFSTENAPLYVLYAASLMSVSDWRHAWQRAFCWELKK